MAKVAVSIKIDVTKIDKARLFQGKAAKYLDATVFIELDEFDQYGNSGMITQDVTKEERQQNVRGNILGNVKVFWKDGETVQQPQQQAAPQQWGNAPKNQPAQFSPQHQQMTPAQQASGGVVTEPLMDFDDSIPF